MRYLLSHILFLALLVPPLAAEEALLGTWGAIIDDDEIGEVTFRVTFRADGTFELSQVLLDFEVPADMSELLPPIGRISYLGIGTYEVMVCRVLSLAEVATAGRSSNLTGFL